MAPAGGIRWLNGPTALEITAAQDMLARFSGFEQLTRTTWWGEQLRQRILTR
ncbi:MAG TPA: hypothetical protein VNB87_09240 [Propionibacteriaceae bacterium]|nr:hypothetical protein [Propionibacteriaceae bacterium]